MVESSFRIPFPNRFRARECGFCVFRGGEWLKNRETPIAVDSAERRYYNVHVVAGVLS